MNNIKSSIAVLLSLSAIFAAGCQPTEPRSAVAAGAAATAGATSKYTFLNAALAKEVPTSGEIQAVKSFVSADVIHAVAILEGKNGTAGIKVEILDKQGNKVAEGSNSGSVILKAAIPVELKAPQGGWVPGDYVAKFYLDGVPNWEVQFNVVQ